jgi:hypothetical protein
MHPALSFTQSVGSAYCQTSENTQRYRDDNTTLVLPAPCCAYEYTHCARSVCKRNRATVVKAAQRPQRLRCAIGCRRRLTPRGGTIQGGLHALVHMHALRVPMACMHKRQLHTCVYRGYSHYAGVRGADAALRGAHYRRVALSCVGLVYEHWGYNGARARLWYASARSRLRMGAKGKECSAAHPC